MLPVEYENFANTFGTETAVVVAVVVVGLDAATFLLHLHQSLVMYFLNIYSQQFVA